MPARIEHTIYDDAVALVEAIRLEEAALVSLANAREERARLTPRVFAAMDAAGVSVLRPRFHRDDVLVVNEEGGLDLLQIVAAAAVPAVPGDADRLDDALAEMGHSVNPSAGLPVDLQAGEPSDDDDDPEPSIRALAAHAALLDAIDQEVA